MNIALFGGTFDPIHAGHLRAAKVAARRFGLDRVLFIPSGNPPHKVQERLTPFVHRLAMVALACSGDTGLIPSLLEAPHRDGRIYYSVDTARAVRKALAPGDRLYFLLGLDSFLDLPHWRQYARLFDLMDFIVVPRPGLRRHELAAAIPAGLVPRVAPATVHLLRGVEMAVASRDIREAVRAGRKVTGLVPKLVEEYIMKEGLYRPYNRHKKKTAGRTR
ncbi:MAG TPA: nicotinate-nucleotide adenylyltransferase [Terriglobia bacterium]|nr:nicotinate-nucleotide adenylyltransferase [Terriglobia bacterium]